MSKPAYDFAGWATKNDLKCSDGRIIKHGAFKGNNGKKVPLVWNHQHNNPEAVLGHAILENRDEGVYAYGKFNDTPAGQHAKESLRNGDITHMSIWANNLQQNGPEVLHGVIQEVSLVLAGANPGAYIESVLAHGMPMEDFDEEGILYTGEGLILSHSIDKEDENKNEGSDDPNKSKGDDEMSKGNEGGNGKTVQEVFDTFTEEQKNVCYALIGQALAEKGDYDDDQEDDDMKHNIFSDNGPEAEYLSHADMQQIFADAKRMGSLREAVQENIEGGILVHSIDTTGMVTATGEQTYGFNDPSMLFPEFRTVGGATPEWLSRNMDWVKKVMSAVHKTPFSRIKSVYANITEDEARARGYIKGKQKKEEVFTTLKRTTTPQTIYKKQKLDRDDVVDITDFDTVAWIKAEMRVMLDEEIARAVLIGDGRPSDSDDKISPEHVRPIVSDVPLFNTTVVVEVAEDADSDTVAKAIIRHAIKARKNYKGSGNPTFWTTEDVLTDMLLLEDGIGHKLYKTEAEVATALRAKEVVTVEPMEGHKVNYGGEDLELIGTIVNLYDYNIGADKGGEVNMFDDFDIDYNQMKYLIETRISGALIKPFSAITLLLKRKKA